MSEGKPLIDALGATEMHVVYEDDAPDWVWVTLPWPQQVPLEALQEGFDELLRSPRERAMTAVELLYVGQALSVVAEMGKYWHFGHRPKEPRLTVVRLPLLLLDVSSWFALDGSAVFTRYSVKIEIVLRIAIGAIGNLRRMGALAPMIQAPTMESAQRLIVGDEYPPDGIVLGAPE